MTKEQQTPILSPSLSKEERFTCCFKLYYEPLCAFIYRIVGSMENAKEISQNVFVKLWEKGNLNEPLPVLKSFLYVSAHYESIDYLRHDKYILQYRKEIMLKYANEAESLPDLFSLKNLKETLEKEILNLPPRCRTIFIMSRYDNLKYKEIAEKLGISVKAVEAQISKGLQILRSKI
jgi:RNA polymerase sigma-70 factor (ECF subfamily)